MPRRGALKAAALMAVLTVLASYDATGSGAGTTVRAASGTSVARPLDDRPNIVLILTDDQRWDDMKPLQTVQSEITAHGVTFNNSFVVNSLCCPSRTSILTGQYSHTTGVYSNSGPYGGFKSFHGDKSTIATWLHDSGYQTALIGKYLNTYTVPYVPPGWDRYLAFNPAGFRGGDYYNYSLMDENKVRASYGSAPEDYSTDVLSGAADDWVRGADPSKPLFLYFAPEAPHSPSTPAPRHKNLFKHLPPFRPPNYNEADMSDKPAWAQALRLLSQTEMDSLDRQRKNRWRSLVAVDEAVGSLIQALQDTGRLSNTMIIFASDNGFSTGEHRFKNKKAAWEESIRVPLIIRYDPLTSVPRTESHIALNVDWAPTMAELAGVSAPGVEGFSLMPFLQGIPVTDWRTDFLIEHMAGGGPLDHHPSDDNPKQVTDVFIPRFCAVRSETYTYVYYLDTFEEELYDLTLDPYEMISVHNDPGYATILDQMRTREAELCNPPPPP
jgi:N-acetylglucosamine-6-sulfatase